MGRVGGICPAAHEVLVEVWEVTLLTSQRVVHQVNQVGVVVRHYAASLVKTPISTSFEAAWVVVSRKCW